MDGFFQLKNVLHPIAKACPILERNNTLYLLNETISSSDDSSACDISTSGKDVSNSCKHLSNDFTSMSTSNVFQALLCVSNMECTKQNRKQIAPASSTREKKTI